MDENRFMNLVNTYKKWTDSLSQQQKLVLYDTVAAEARRKEINRRLQDFVTHPKNDRVNFINFDNEILGNIDKYRDKRKPHIIDNHEFRRLLTTVFPDIDKYRVKNQQPAIELKSSQVNLYNGGYQKPTLTCGITRLSIIIVLIIVLSVIVFILLTADYLHIFDVECIPPSRYITL